MKQPRTRISRVVAERTLSSGVSKKFSNEVAAYLLSERRVNEVDSILRDVQQYWAQAGRVEVIARSAHSLSPVVIQDITKQVKNLYPDAKEIIVTAVLDPEVIGGVQLMLPNQQLDLSVQAKLTKFKQLTSQGKD